MIACGNETGIKMYDISEYGSQAVVEIQAHADNVKKVQFLSE